MDEYVCLTLLSNVREAESDFKSRLSRLWSVMLRQQPDTFEKVYAEATRCASADGRLTRQYLVESIAVELLSEVLATEGVALEPVDLDDTYSKYEAAPPDWFWIEH